MLNANDDDNNFERKKRKERPRENEQAQGNMRPTSSSSMPSTESSVKKRTGRPRGTGKLQQIASIGQFLHIISYQLLRLCLILFFFSFSFFVYMCLFDLILGKFVSPLMLCIIL